MSSSLKKKLWFSFFIVIQIILSVSPLGFIYFGGISVTLLTIPVILGAFLFGKKEGIILGFLFGFLSLLRASFTPDISAFLFSPFVQVGGHSGNLYSLVICFFPRIFLGWFVGMMKEKFGNKQWLSLASITFIASMIHTLLVLLCIFLFFAKEYSALMNISSNLVLAGLGIVFATNGISEAIVAVLLVPTIYQALPKMK